ncbi:Epidermal growth factor receptor substrate 15 [Symbiodinium microadriaticum]|uniref:Epidermal growth factor receptor substrate 15 n=1 Tax=Symbiodinium microadriaticum TaxID=2951 RepID=A0A1Q9D099_SYMMI|nr:Epidermal growth factor receptor substrate 15 [Symbiodinium microadriaticum]CAE7537607.1 EPS15 [Symbiodinium microadriaticum]
MQQGHSSIQFSQQELEYYQQLYGIANPAGTQSIDSISGGQFLVLSDLPRESLHEIWKIASANATQGYLHVEGFYVACRLVAWAQSGIQPDPQCVYQEPPVLPDFPGLQRRSPSEPSGQGSRPQSVGGSEQSELQPVIGGRGRRQENTQRARSSSPRTFTVDRWAPSRREKRKYASLFKRTDWDQDGFVQGNEASELLERSGLERSSLGRAWELADQDCDGKLDFSEFVCLVHLVTCALRGQRIPGPGEGLPHQLALSLASLEPLEVLAAEREASRSRSRSASPHPSVTGTQLEHRGERRARSSSPRTFTADRWAPSRREKRKYASLFKRTDWDQDGFVQGNEASELLERSGLERSSLGRAWELADQDCDGKLDFSEFVCLVHLVTCALRGQRIPGPGEGLPHQLALSLASLEPLEVLAAEREASRSRSRSASPHPSVTPGEPAVAELPDPFAAGESFPSVETKDAGNWQSTGFEDTAAFASGFESEGGFASGGFQDSTADFGFPAFPDGQIDQPFEAGAAGAASWPQELPEFEQPVSAFDDGAFEGKDPFATDHLGLSGPAEQLQLVANFDGKLARKLRDEVDQLDTELRRLQDADVKLEQQAAHESRECERLLSQKQILERELAEDKQKLQQLQDARSNANLESLSLRRDRNHLSHELAFLRQVAENDEEMLLMLRQSNQYLEASHRNLESNSEMLKEIRKEVQVEIAKEREQLQLDQRQYAELKATLEQLSRPGQDPSSLSEDGPGKSLADTLTERLKPLPTSALLPPKSFPHREGV